MRIDEIRARCESATPGPWVFKHGKDDDGRLYNEVVAPCPCCGLIATTHPIAGAGDAKFIAYAREDIPYLLSEIATLKAQNQEMKEILDGIKATSEFPELEDKNDRLTAELEAYKQIFNNRIFWIRHNVYGDECAVPVSIIRTTDGGFTVRWEITDEYSEEIEEIDATDLFHTEEDALTEIDLKAYKQQEKQIKICWCKDCKWCSDDRQDYICTNDESEWCADYVTAYSSCKYCEPR